MMILDRGLLFWATLYMCIVVWRIACVTVYCTQFKLLFLFALFYSYFKRVTTLAVVLDVLRSSARSRRSWKVLETWIF